jgi:hypothetical protein
LELADGVYTSSIIGEYGNEYQPGIKSGESREGAIIIDGAFGQYDKDWNMTLFDGGIRKLRLADDVKITGSGGDGADVTYTMEQIMDIINNPNGLGFDIEIKGGKVVRIGVSS